MNHPNYAILVLSCDKYSDLWKPFFSQFHKFWPRCPFNVYLGSNTKKFHHTGVRTILSGPGIDWSSDLLAILDLIKEEYLYIWMEDFFPVGIVDTNLFQRTFQFMEKANVNHVHMQPYIRPDGICDDKLFGFYGKGIPYRVNAPGFWKKSHLRELLIPGENPWKFEIMGSYRASYYDGYYCINKQVFQFIRIVEKGAIRREAYNYCMKSGVSLDIHRRHINTLPEEVKSRVEKYMFDRILSIPWRARVGMMDTLRRLVASY